jgi:uncharacterized protein YlzI (FlbEa/FlbD family)
MADNEKNAVIILDSGKHFNVQSTVVEIESQITAEKEKGASLQKGASLPTIKVVDESGREIWVNANHIAVFHEYVSGRPLVAFA